MFKPESYITPILLSYVDKYIKNFRLEDSQVSLWGGDASFHNLDLRLEVLEQELQLPFSFVSGHIHELLIHVPWIKLTSEPITVTINTIECILKLKRHGARSHSDTSLQSREKRKSSQKEALEAPPTYMQSIINKIVNNIRIYCNNLILKYVEEDIVLSMNVKHFKVETADDKWEPAFIDVSTGHVTQRKVISLNDLTICLDKRNSAGKIDVYQEPMLYRCSLTMHLMRTYHSATANKTSITRLDIYCNSMEFSMTEQQVPMVMRLLLLMYTLQQHQFKLDSENGTEAANTSTETRDRENKDTWTGWVWSYVSLVLPSQWDEDWQENPLMNQRGHSFHSGIYINEMSVVFKVSDANPSHTFYAQRKVRYIPVMALYLQGIYMDNKMHGIQWMNVQGGVSSILLLPIGFCTCGHLEIPDNKDAEPYLKIGSISDLYQKDSLFDQNAVENQGGLRAYSTDWSYHMAVNDTTMLLEKTSAFGFDYVYSLQIPDDMSADALSEIGSDLEYSNFHEEVSVRAVFGSMVLRLCSGFFHRMDSLKVAGSVYEYPPYVVPKPLPTRDELLPPSAEDFDALNEHISTKTLRIILNSPVIELQLFDHPSFVPTLDKLFRRKRKYSSLAEALYISHLQQQSFLPKLIFECQTIHVSSVEPLYNNRLIFTTCQLPDPPKHMFDACYIQSDYKVVNMSCKLVLNPNKQTIIMVPFSFSYQTREIIKPDYWTNPDVPFEEVVFEIESFTINGTKAKQLIISQIIGQAWNSYYHLMGWGNVEINDGNPAGITTLIVDAFRDYIMPCLELCVENIRFKSVTTNSIYSLDASLGSIKGFIFESVPPKVPQTVSSSSGFSLYDIQQILFISGPEPKSTAPLDLDIYNKSNEDVPLFTMTIQYPLNPHTPSHPSLFIFNLQEIRVCMDPLFCKWFLYKPKVIKTNTDIYSQKRRTPSEASSSIKEAPKRIHTPKESVHSSEKDASHILEFSNENPTEESSVDLQDKVYNFLITWFNVWKGMLLYGDICQCTIYFPMESLSAVGSQGIQEAVNQAVNKQPPADVMVVALPLASIRSTQKQDMSKYLKMLPIKLPDTFWSLEKTTFPWTVSISDLSCYTIQYGNKLLFLNPVSLNATVGLSTRSSKSSSATLTESVGNSTVAIDKADIACLGVCVHIDMTSIVISTSEIQMYLLTSILYGLVEMASYMAPDIPSVAAKTADVSNPVVITEFPPVSPPPVMKESTLETLSESSYPLSSSAAQMGESDSVKLTAWVQCTITKFSVELFSCDMTNVNSIDFYRNSKLKFVLDAEDIVTSLDFQSVYLKMKCKIGLVSMQHFKRKSANAKWTHGSFSGIIMRLRDDIVTNDRHEDNGFISVTITRASCQHTHTLWGATQKRKTTKKSNPLAKQQVSSRYITEIVVNIQPIDMIIPLKTLRKFYLIVQPLLNISMPKGVGAVQQATHSSAAYNNQNLPLAYLDCQDIRIIMPSSEMRESKAMYDVLIVQIHKIKLNPSAVNPICRTPSRPDIYQQAAQARLLNIPGSELEDRQYQMDIISLSVSTGVWDNLEAVLTSPTNVISALHGASENPALEWNNLERGQLNINPVLKLWQVTEKFDINIVVAPAMVYRDVVICGNSMEVNLITDIFINLSLSQIKLMSSIAEEFTELVQPLQAATQVCPFYEIKIPFKFDAQFEQDSDIDLLEVLRDSGVDTSDMKSMGSLKTLIHAPPLEPVPSNVTTHVPEVLSNEVLFTGGKIRFSLYCLDTTYFRLTPHKKRTWQHMHVIDEDNGYDASEEGSVVDDMQGMGNKFMPLLYLSLSQPNLYLSSYHSGERFQVSCFDIDIRVSSAEQIPIRRIPSEDDFKLRLIETRSGKPSAVTGILPAFFTLKYFKAIGKPAVLDIDIMKPSKLIISPKIICRVLQLNQMIAQSLREIRVSGSSNVSVENVSTTGNSDVVVQEHYVKFGEIKELLYGIGTVNISLEQILLSLKSNHGPEMSFSFGKAYNHLNICNKPEKVTNIATIKCMTLSVKMTNFTKILLNPWSVSVETNLYWESWQDSNSDPQVQILGESDSLMIDISQEHLRYLRLITKELEDFMSSFPCDSNGEASSVTVQPTSTRPVDRLPSPISDKEQYYKDDLRAGAFQFVDASSSNTSLEMPLPYQVMFWCEPLSAAMAWRYPQPRALTKVRIFPVPYKLTEDTRDSSQVLCYLEYWSECHNMYLPYCQFFLSENEVVDLQLPDDDTQKVVACTWRVVLKFIDENSEFVDNFHPKSGISPRVLAACMRIDSYFNKNLIPRLAVALNISRIEISLYSYFDKTSTLILPHPLKQYSSDLFFPESHSFLTLTFENLKSHLIFWDFERICSDITVLTKCSVIDYAFLTRQPFVESFASRLELKVANNSVCNFTANPVNIKCCPGIAHALAVNAQLWSQTLNQEDENVEKDFIVITRYVICNDSDINLRFGQFMTEEDLLLPPKYFSMYSWRSQKQKQLLKVGLEQNDWVWSEAFSIDQTGTQMIPINTEGLNWNLVVTVRYLSSTQKQIVLGGQFLVSNMLLEHFDLKIVEAVENTDKDRLLKNSPVHIVAGKSVTPSMFIDTSKKHFLRLRFFGLNSAWTGDIPLTENAKGTQPWLVKVPLQERGQFLSIWCRVVEENLGGRKKLLAMLWPLFAIRSNLPINMKVQIETKALNINRMDEIRGRGELQQLHCPGTVDHAHELTFTLNECPMSNESIPLNYSMVDQETFFQKSENQNIDSILESISKYDEINWPHSDDEWAVVNWITDDQPLTHIQVKYVNACPYSSTLLVELIPWCLMVNVFGYPVSVIVDGVELCSLPHNGIVAPPKLEDTFALKVIMGDMWRMSPPLQLAKSNWSQSFYMPTITGSIPVEGTIKTTVTSKSYISMLSISSQMKGDVRLLKLSSTHVLTNYMSTQAHVICYAVPEVTDKLYEIPVNLERFAFAVAPHPNKNKCGLPVVQWHLVDKHGDLSVEFALYMMFSLEPEFGWSCPVRVDKPVNRKSINLNAADKSYPVVVICQELKGQMFVTLLEDTSPQTCIENITGKTLYIGQSCSNGEAAAAETAHFNWHCKVEDGRKTYYTTPLSSDKFPEIPQVNFPEQLVFSSGVQEDNQYHWSEPVDITNNIDQFLRIPYSMDIRVIVRNTACTTFILLESVSKIEIRAKDIRVRLSKQETATVVEENRKTEDKHRNLPPIKESVSDMIQSITPSTSAHHSERRTQTADVRQSSFKLRNKRKQQSRSGSESSIKKSSTFSNPYVTNKNTNLLEITAFLSSISITLIEEDRINCDERSELGLLTCDNVALAVKHGKVVDIHFSISDIQFDNQAYSRAPYDFPVVLIGQKQEVKQKMNALNTPIKRLLSYATEDALFSLKIVSEICKDISFNGSFLGMKDVNVSIQPLSCFIEDIFMTSLNEYLSVFSPDKVILWPNMKRDRANLSGNLVCVPDAVLWQALMFAQPITLRTICIEPLSLSISMHCTVKLYVALDQSPLDFRKFERKRVCTTSYRLGHALAMQYMSSAIFGAGWVVSSLELLGSPGGFARTMGAGLRDFINLPYRGLFQGPWAFLAGITHGSASLMKHATAGTLQSLTKMASSFARNFDKLTMDEEHVRRAEELRRQKPQGLTQGLAQGLTGMGISLLGAVGGLAHHPIQSLMSPTASAKSVAAGLGLGLVGIVTKPLSSAAELVALAGQGLLQGAGWTSLPCPRTNPTVYRMISSSNAVLKYSWKFVHAISHANLLYVAEATAVTQNNIFNAVDLILTTEALIIFNTDLDVFHRVTSLSEVSTQEGNLDPTLLCFKLTPPVTRQKNEDENMVEMDPACRARVADYVRNTAGLLHLADDGSHGSSDFSISPLSTPVTHEDHQLETTVLNFYVNPLCRNYFLCLLALSKQQGHNYHFPLL